MSLMGKLIIITGGPGSGKTTLLQALKLRGFMTYDEVPRFLIEKYLIEDQSLLPWNNLDSFAEKCLREMIRQKYSALEYNISFSDRAIGDILAYLKIGKIDPLAEYWEEAKKGYCNDVFLLKPQEEFYVQDEVRPHTFSEALEIHKEIESIYNQLGFTVNLIPYTTVENQIDVITDTIGL